MGLPLLAVGVEVHWGEDVGVDLTPVLARPLVARVDGVRVPVSPEERVFVEREGKGVRQRAFDHHLPVEGATELRTSYGLQ